MKKAIITTFTMLGILMFPLNAMAADRDSSKHRPGDPHESRHDRHHDSQERHSEARKERHQDWKQHREHRRAAIKHHQIENTFNGHRIKTNHRAVKKRVAAYKIKHQRHMHRQKNNWLGSHPLDSGWEKSRHNDSRFLSRRDFYNHYYGRGNPQHYERHREHYLSHGHRQNRYRGSHHHQHDNSYLEWIGIMALLNNIYDDENY